MRIGRLATMSARGGMASARYNHTFSSHGIELLSFAVYFRFLLSLLVNSYLLLFPSLAIAGPDIGLT